MKQQYMNTRYNNIVNRSDFYCYKTSLLTRCFFFIHLFLCYYTCRMKLPLGAAGVYKKKKCLCPGEKRVMYCEKKATCEKNNNIPGAQVNSAGSPCTEWIDRSIIPLPTRRKSGSRAQQQHLDVKKGGLLRHFFVRGAPRDSSCAVWPTKGTAPKARYHRRHIMSWKDLFF